VKTTKKADFSVTGLLMSNNLLTAYHAPLNSAKRHRYDFAILKYYNNLDD
jgi:hypothetical protein